MLMPRRTDEQRARDRERLRKRREDGICYQCSERAEPGRTKCRKHLDEQAAYGRRWARMRGKAPGVCNQGGCTRPCAPGLAKCRACRLRKSDAYYRRKREGLCGREGCRERRQAGKSLCAKHLRAFRERVAAEVKRRRAAGLCGMLGCPTASPRFFYCLKHRLARQRWRQALREGPNTDPVLNPDDLDYHSGDESPMAVERI